MFALIIILEGLCNLEEQKKKFLFFSTGYFYNIDLIDHQLKDFKV